MWYIKMEITGCKMENVTNVENIPYERLHFTEDEVPFKVLL